MTVTTTIICDECGKDITAANDRIEAKVCISHPGWSVGEPSEMVGKVDLCQPCLAKLGLVGTGTSLIRAIVREKIEAAS